MANAPAPARSLLAAVPYAFKSMDAETLNGRAAADYVTREDLQSTVDHAVAAFKRPEPLPVRVTPPLRDATLSAGPGVDGYVPLWTGTTTLGTSTITQSGRNVGIGTSTPATMLDVNGTSTLRAAVSLLASAATLAASINSPALQLGASTYSSAGHAAVPQNFVWQAQSAGNNTANLTANLALLFGSGTTPPTDTGLSIAPNGQITFASGQTFPGTGGETGPTSSTLTGVAAGPGLTGGGSTRNVTLALSMPISTATGGTGAVTPAEALANLGGLPLTGGTMTGPLAGSSASFSGTVVAGTTVPAPSPVNVKHSTYGCKGDGTTDDTACLQAAINAAQSNKDEVDLPFGTYPISTTLIITAPVKMRCIGSRAYHANAGACAIKKSSTFSSSVLNTPALFIQGGAAFGDGAGGTTIEGIAIGNNGSTDGGDGIEITAHKVTLRDVTVSHQAGWGIRIGEDTNTYDANMWVLDNVASWYNGTAGTPCTGGGLYISSGTTAWHGDAEAGTSIGGSYSVNSCNGVSLGGTANEVFMGGDIESNAGIGFEFMPLANANQLIKVDSETNKGGNLVFDSGASRNVVNALVEGWTDANVGTYGTTNTVYDGSGINKLGRLTNGTGALCYGCGPTSGTGYALEVPDSGSGQGAIAATNFTTGGATKIGIRHANGTGVAGGPSNLTIAQVIRGFFFDGYYNAWTIGAYTDCVLDAAPGSGVMPCAYRIFTNSGGTVAERFRVNSFGGIAVGGVGSSPHTGIYLGGSQLVGTTLQGIESDPTYPTTTTQVFSFWSYPIIQTGTAATLVSHYVAADGGITAGTVATEYGYYDAGLTKGTTANWGVYTQTKSYFGAGLINAGINAAKIGTAIASATTIAPVSPIVHITGIIAITTITPQTGCTTAGTGCQVTLIPDGLWATGTGGNIAIASTAVVSKALTMTYDPATAKWYPSY